MSRAEPAPAAASHDDNKESVDSMRQAIREGREYEADLINKMSARGALLSQPAHNFDELLRIRPPDAGSPVGNRPSDTALSTPLWSLIERIDVSRLPPPPAGVAASEGPGADGAATR